MTTTLERAIDKIRERAADDPEFADAVVQFASDEVTDPFAPVAPAMLEVAQELNRQRQRTRADELRAESLTTAEVVELLASVNDRKGVDRRRKRGTLLGIRVGRNTFHPQWQFDRRRRETWPGLTDVLAALRAVTADDLDESTSFDVPTTVAKFGGKLYLPNARFGTAATPDTDYWVTKVRAKP